MTDSPEETQFLAKRFRTKRHGAVGRHAPDLAASSRLRYRLAQTSGFEAVGGFALYIIGRLQDDG